MNNSNNQIIRNVMEVLVAEEVDRQISYYQQSFNVQINSLDVISYALNRLPALYASSEEGFKYQQIKAEIKLKKEIEQVVKEGFMTILQEPYRPFIPLIGDLPQETKEEREFKEFLSELTTVLPNKDYKYLLTTFQKVFNKMINGQLTPTELKKIQQDLWFGWNDTRYNL